MKKIFLTVALLALSVSGRAADGGKVPYFQDCSVLKTEEFSSLRKYLKSTEDGTEFANLCFRLSAREFIYTTDFNLFYCTFSPQAKCREYDEGRQYRNIQVVREFTGPNGKRFVLLRTGLLRQGISSQEYEVFYLKPKSPDGVPFVIRDLVGAAEADGEGDDASLCEEGDLRTRVADERSRILGYSIQNEGAADVRLEFKTITEDCDSGKKTTELREFVYGSSGFVDNSPRPAVNPATPRLSSPRGLAVDSRGNAYVALPKANTILRIAPNGQLSTFAGGNKGFKDGVGLSAMFSMPLALAIDASDNLYVSDADNLAIRRVTSDGEVTTVAKGFEVEGLAVDSGGNIVASCVDHTVRRIGPNGVVTILAGGSKGYADGAGSAAKFTNIAAVAVDSVGNAYIVDHANAAIRKITPAGVVTTFIRGGDFAESISDERSTGKPTSMNGVVVGKGDVLYFSDSFGVFKKVPGEPVRLVTGFKRKGFADGRIDMAEFNYPENLAFDRVGSLYVLDEGNEAVRKVSPDGRVTTVAARRKPSAR